MIQASKLLSVQNVNSKISAMIFPEPVEYLSFVVVVIFAQPITFNFNPVKIPNYTVPLLCFRKQMLMELKKKKKKSRKWKG